MKRPVLRYHGSKFRIAKWIISHFPTHTLYLEPFGGSGAVLMQKPRAKVEIFNDLNQDIVNLFRILRDPLRSQILELQLRMTPFSREEYYDCIPAYDGTDPIERARRLVVRAFLGHGGDSVFEGRRSGFRVSATQNRCSSKDWVTYWDAIPQFSDRLSGVIIENKDAFDLMARFDSPDALFYLDPPYVHATRNTNHKYPFDMKNDEHVRLVEFVKTLKASVVISGYRHPIYSKLYWDSFEKEATKDKGVKATEVIWLNNRAMTKTEPLFMVRKDA